MVFRWKHSKRLHKIGINEKEILDITVAQQQIPMVEQIEKETDAILNKNRNGIGISERLREAAPRWHQTNPRTQEWKKKQKFI